jgi:hypothetical protein
VLEIQRCTTNYLRVRFKQTGSMLHGARSQIEHTLHETKCFAATAFRHRSGHHGAMQRATSHHIHMEILMQYRTQGGSSGTAKGTACAT